MRLQCVGGLMHGRLDDLDSPAKTHIDAIFADVADLICMASVCVCVFLLLGMFIVCLFHRFMMSNKRTANSP